GDRHILLVVEHVRQWGGMPGFVRLEAPQRLSCLCVGGHERAAFFAEDYQAGGGGKRPSPGVRGFLLRQFPRDLAGLNVDGSENSLWRGLGSRWRAALC